MPSKPMTLGLVAVLMWSTIAVGFKLGLRHLEPIQLLWLGCCFSWLLFTICIVLRPELSASRRDITRAAIFGLLNPLLYYVVLLTAYDLLPAHIAQPVNYTWAIVTALLAVPLLKQQLTGKTILGILVSYFGVLLLITKGSFSLDLQVNPLGLLLAVVSTVIWAFYWIWTKTVQMQPWWFMWFGFTSTLPLITLVCILTDGLPAITLTHLSFGAWIGLFEMGFAFLLWQRAIATTDSVAKVSQLIFISPVISLVLIYLVLNEPIHLSALVGIALILSGLVVVNQRQVKPRQTS